ncbi:MAG: hypothetical protein K9I94_13040 [Bacteroidales bacterium]|nr:hypothetical protein [Bacteroidales bacterium]
MKTLLITIGFILAFQLGCDKNNGDNEVEIDCAKLHEGLVEMDEQKVAAEVNRAASNLYPVVSDKDQYGHKNNLNILITRIDDRCSEVEASLDCYACIETYPPKSKIKLAADSAGQNLTRTILILTPEDGLMSYSGIE